MVFRRRSGGVIITDPTPEQWSAGRKFARWNHSYHEARYGRAVVLTGAQARRAGAVPDPACREWHAGCPACMLPVRQRDAAQLRLAARAAVRRGD